MFAQPVHAGRIRFRTRPTQASRESSRGRLLSWTLFILLAGVLVMLVLTNVGRFAQATVPPVIRDTRSPFTADYSPWSHTTFQPVRPSIMQAIPADDHGAGLGLLHVN